MGHVISLDALQRRALWLVAVMLLLGLLIAATGLYASMATESLSTTGCPSGVIVSEHLKNVTISYGQVIMGEHNGSTRRWLSG